MAAASSQSQPAPDSSSNPAAAKILPKRKQIGVVDGKPYETIVGTPPLNFQRRKICHIDIWRGECRMWLDTTEGRFYAPPFDQQTGEFGEDDFRIFQTQVLREVFATFTVKEALLVDFEHGQLIEPKGTQYGTVQFGESIAFALEVQAPLVDLAAKKEAAAKRRFDKLQVRLERGGKKLRSKRKKK